MPTLTATLYDHNWRQSSQLQIITRQIESREPYWCHSYSDNYKYVNPITHRDLIIVIIDIDTKIPWSSKASVTCENVWPKTMLPIWCRHQLYLWCQKTDTPMCSCCRFPSVCQRLVSWSTICFSLVHLYLYLHC